MSTPLWRVGFDLVERPLAAFSESWVQSDVFMDVAALGFKVQRRATKQTEKALDAWLGAWGLPTRRDVTRWSTRSRAWSASCASCGRERAALMAPNVLERQVLRARNGLAHLAGTNEPRVATAPRDLVWKLDKGRLWRYRSESRSIRPPILIVHSLVSKSYILDLLPSNSMIGFLRDEGFDVFLLDWVAARPGGRREHARDLRRPLHPAGDGRGGRGVGRRRADRDRLLLRRHPHAAAGRRAPRAADPQPDLASRPRATTARWGS